MAVGNHYRVTLSGNLVGQTVKNIFWYRNDIANSDASSLSSYFLLNILPQIGAALSTALTFTDLEVVNMEDAGDFKIDAFSVSGLRSGDFWDAFSAYGFTYFANSLAFRSGGKRFAGVAESDVTNGIPVASQLLRLDNIAVALGLVIPVGSARFRPSFFSHRCIKNPTTHKCTDEFIDSFGTFATCAWKWVTTQNSRKRGVGV